MYQFSEFVTKTNQTEKRTISLYNKGSKVAKMFFYHAKSWQHQVHSTSKESSVLGHFGLDVVLFSAVMAKV